MSSDMKEMKLEELYHKWPWVDDFFTSHEIDVTGYKDKTVAKMFSSIDDEFFFESGTTRNALLRDLELFVDFMCSIEDQAEKKITSIDIVPGQNKSGQSENISVRLKSGEVTAIVGPTGSGKSRLLEDIECLAAGDTPTRRHILVNGVQADDDMRYAMEECLVAQLSQNMNFVMDLSVEDFITMHAESRMLKNSSELVEAIYQKANELAGEKFGRDIAVTQLSGGQSRALMIADTALLSKAPIILIDEIENAGVDKIKALELLISNQKIVLISTHDPILALSAHQRIIIKNGGMHDLIKTTDAEKSCLTELSRLDDSLTAIRNSLRSGEVLQSLAL